jgi:hypothetical protein
MALLDAIDPPTGTSDVSSFRYVLTERPQTLRHQEFKLLLGKDADVSPDALPARIFGSRLLRQLARVKPVRQSVLAFHHVSSNVEQATLVQALDAFQHWIPLFLFWGVERAPRQLLQNRWIRLCGVIMRNGQLTQEVGRLIVP